MTDAKRLPSVTPTEARLLVSRLNQEWFKNMPEPMPSRLVFPWAYIETYQYEDWSDGVSTFDDGRVYAIDFYGVTIWSSDDTEVTHEEERMPFDRYIRAVAFDTCIRPNLIEVSLSPDVLRELLDRIQAEWDREKTRNDDED